MGTGWGGEGWDAAVDVHEDGDVYLDVVDVDVNVDAYLDVDLGADVNANVVVATGWAVAVPLASDSAGRSPGFRSAPCRRRGRRHLAVGGIGSRRKRGRGDEGVAPQGEEAVANSQPEGEN